MVDMNQSQRILHALIEAGLQNPDLRDYYEFHHTVLKLLDQARLDMPEDVPITVEGTILDSSNPLLPFDQLPIEGYRFARLVGMVAQALTTFNPEYEGQSVPENPAECLQLARQRFAKGLAHKGQKEPQDTVTLAQLSVDQALRPYLEWGAERLRPYMEKRVWRQAYCPICGGAPDFASLDEESGTRHLLCSRCNTQWLYHRLGCPFCGTMDHTKISYHLSDDGVYRLYICQECQRYLKTIDLRQTHSVVLLPLERVTSVAMDAAALEAGYW